MWFRFLAEHVLGRSAECVDTRRSVAPLTATREYPSTLLYGATGFAGQVDLP